MGAPQSVSIVIPNLTAPLILDKAAPSPSGDFAGVDANNLGIAQSMEVLLDWYYKPLQAQTRAQAFDNLKLQGSQELVEMSDTGSPPLNSSTPSSDVARVIHSALDAELTVGGQYGFFSIDVNITYATSNPPGSPSSTRAYVYSNQIQEVPLDYPQTQASLAPNKMYRRPDGTYFYTVANAFPPLSGNQIGTTGDKGIYEFPVVFEDTSATQYTAVFRMYSDPSAPKIDGLTLAAYLNDGAAGLPAGTPTYVSEAHAQINDITQNSPSRQNLLQSLLTGFQELFSFVNTLVKRAVSFKSEMIANIK